MKNLRNIFAILILLVASVGMYSCDSEVTIDDPQTEKTGEEGNETDERDGA